MLVTLFAELSFEARRAETCERETLSNARSTVLARSIKARIYGKQIETE